MWPSEILRIRIAGRSEITTEDIAKIILWLEENSDIGCAACANGRETGAQSKIEKLGQRELLSEEEVRELYELAAEVQLAYLLSHYPILPFNSPKYDSLREIFRNICDSNDILAGKYGLLLGPGDEWDSLTAFNFIRITEPLLERDADTIAGVLSHELAHLESGHMLRWLCDFFAKRGRIDLLVLDLQCDTKADTHAVGYMARAGYCPSRLIEHLERAKNYVAELPESHFADEPQMRMVYNYFLDERIESLEKIIRGPQ